MNGTCSCVIQDFDGSMDLRFFNSAEVDNVIKSVEERSSDGVVQGNVKLLLNILQNEVNVHGSASGQRQQLMEVCKSTQS